jgi:hypothetical protein
MKRAVFIGTMVILFFSIWPMRAVNSLCCLGVVAGGLLTGVVCGRAQGGSLEAVQAIRLGATSGILASLLALGINALVAEGWISVPSLDPIPDFIYTFLNGIWEGIRDLPDSGGAAWADSPGYWTRVAFQLPSNALFGLFGGAIASSLFRRQPPILRRNMRPQQP